MSSKVVRQVRRVAVAATLALASAGAASAETLTDALISAYRNSQLLEQNRALLRAADENVAQSVAALRPVLAFVASASQTEVRPAPILSSGSTTTASVRLSASISLYDGGSNRLAVEGAKENVLATRAGLVNIEQTVLYNAVSAYTSLRSAIDSVALSESNVRLSTEQLRAARDRFEVGEVTRTDVSQAESALARAQSGEAAARGALLQAREAYNAAIGHYPGRLTGSPRVPQIPGSLDSARALAVKTHPSIMAAQHDVTAAEILVKRARAARGPSVDLTGSYGVNDSGTETATLGVQLNQTIYAGGGLVSAERQANANRDSARSALHLSVQGVEQEVGVYWATLLSARAQLEAADKQIQAAQLAYDGTREEARLGARTTLDVLDAQQALLDARTARVDAETALFNSYYLILRAVGLLTVEHLNLGIPTYDPAAYYNAVKSAPSFSRQGSQLDQVMKALGKE